MINLISVSKKINGKPVLNNVNLNVKKGEFITIFGSNGCGKTTLLELMAGILQPSSGKIIKQGSLGFVFQNYAESMFPWYTLVENVIFPLEVKRVDRSKREGIVGSLLCKVNLWSHKDKYFYELSGGMKQLTAICRAIVGNPDVLLLDEPFSSLDYNISRKMQNFLLRLWEGKTAVFVSHNIDEAILLGDKVVLMDKNKGEIKKIIQVNLSRPRTINMVKTKKFFEIKNKILGYFEDE